MEPKVSSKAKEMKTIEQIREEAKQNIENRLAKEQKYQEPKENPNALKSSLSVPLQNA